MTVLKVESQRKSDIFTTLNNFGHFQIIQFILICLSSTLSGMLMLNYVFVAEIVEYRCKIPDCEDSNATVNVPHWWDSSIDLKCHRPVTNQDGFSITNRTCSFSNKVEKCQEWFYDNDKSFMADLNLACQESKISLIGMMHNVGLMVSNVIAGWFCDRFGRRKALLICTIGGTIGLMKIFARNLFVYSGIEFLEAFITSGIQTSGLVLLIEIGGESKRVLVGVLFSYAFYMGEIIYAALATGIKNWKTLVLALYTPNLLFMMYFCTLFESTRWQILQGETKAAKKTFSKIAKFNRLDISEEEIEGLSQEELLSFSKINEQGEKETLADVLKSKEILIRLLVTCFCFFATSFAYYGLAVNSVYLPGNKYTNFMLTSLTSFPGDFLAFFGFSKFGRRATLQAGFLSCALSLLAQAFSPKTSAWLTITLYLFGKLWISMCFTGIFVYSLELFPTSVRGMLVGCGNTFVRIGSIMAPLTPLLGNYVEELPAVLFAVASVISAFLLCFTPETKVLPLFDTILQVETHRKTSSDSQSR